MWKLWQIHGPVWSPADEGGQGGGDQGGSQGDDDGGDSGASGDEGDKGGKSSILDFASFASKAGSEGDQGDKGGKSSILDFASFASKAGSEGDQGDGAWKLPDGLEIPEHLVGTSAEDTLAKLSKAYKGARQDVSKGGKDGGLEGTVPDSPDGYTFEADGDDDKIAAEINSEASKPIMDAFKKAAHKHKIPDKAFTAFLRDGIAELGEQGISIGNDEDVQRVNGEAEMAALSEEVGAKEASTIINTISNYGEKLAAKGVLQNEDDVAEFTQMVGTARAARIFHRLLVGELGEKPIPSAVGMDGQVTPQEAYAAHAAALKLPAGSERDQAVADANAKMQKAFGEGGSASGSIRSNVL